MRERPVSLLEWAYNEIKQQLFIGKLQPGEKIIVGQLAESLSISPTPVKEALNRLVAEGLMITLPRRGFMVKQLTMKEIHDIMNCRIMLEVFAVKQAVHNFPKHPEIKKNMLDVLKKLENIQTHDYVEATQLEQVYHGAFIQLTENQKLIELYNMLFGVGFAFYVYSSSNHPMERHRIALNEHKLMYEYLEKGNSDALEKLLRTHLEKTMEFYETFLPAFALDGEQA
ncbi:GntR family transcriptional regulator [Hydrogenoanaerobacterium sp.]|uniref:GntR family transcriptional regulator n=1 Tax=Hydrogenoanaerobacterium sp. TaxID=2953763 RepID=UPI00289A85E7|nr:GntR family transcriptional regulator [Hydrogenoanaerobacterium sp.]